MRNAIRELASHRREGKKIIFYIILSRAGIEDDSMMLWIVDCLREFRAKGSWLVFQFRENDLRNALSGVIGGVELALMSPEDPEACQEQLRLAQKSAQNAVTIASKLV